MEELIRFYMLEQPRSVSDMIEELTEKELSPDPGKRSDEIPRIAGNWFRKDSGYLWRLRENGVISDRGRQYLLSREMLVDDLVRDLQVTRCFPDTGVRGDGATLNDAYSQLMPDMTLGELKERLRDELFSASTMKEMFSFDRWKNTLLEPDTNQNTVASYRLRLGFWPSIHFILISAVLASRERHVQERRLDESDHYFRWRSRQQSLEETREDLRDAIVGECFPWAEKGDDGAFSDEGAQRLSEGFDEGFDGLEPETTELLANLYLLSFNDGVELFTQYSHYDHDINLLFNLMERGWMVDQRNLEQDEHTGNIVIPLGDVRSYIHDLRALFRRDAS